MRAQQTARVIADILNVKLTLMSDLAEVGIGHLEGATDPATRARTAEVLHAWIVHQNLETRVADGENGHQVVARISSAFRTIAPKHRGDTVVVVGQVASLSTGLSVLGDLGPRIWGTPLPHATPFTITYDGRSWTCPMWPKARG